MTYVLNRLLSVIWTRFLITLVTFAVTNILPGDVAMMIMGTQSNEAALEGLRQSLGLSDPLIVQYWRWIGWLDTANFLTDWQRANRSSQNPSALSGGRR
jgi:ABC-type dipeptide/oligopeptide/nickel transport system permease component